MAQEGVRLLMGLVDKGSQKGLSDFLNYQFTDDMFRGDELDLYREINGHASKYGALPDRSTLVKWAKQVGIPLPVPEEIVEPPAYYFDKLEERNLKLDLLQTMKTAEECRVANPQQSLELLSEGVLTLTTHRQRARLVNIAEKGEEIIHAELLKAAAGEDTGLAFGWPTLDNMSGGLRGGDLVSIIGRPGMGKTYMALHGMINAWNRGYTTLFVSMEMQSTPIVKRVVSMYTHTSIGELNLACVSSKQTKTMYKKLRGMSGAQGMWVADGRLSVSVNDLVLLCRLLQPDVVYVDGAYMLRAAETDHYVPRYERINRNSEDVKILAEELDIPIVQTFQFNRGMTKKKNAEDVDLEDIAGSDAIGQLSSLVLGTFQDDNIETKLARRVRVLKGRNGEQGEFMINWRFGGFGQKQGFDDKDTSDIMNFTEILKEDVNNQMQFM